jgi:hypothetical protein
LLLGARFFRDGIAEIHKITEPNLERAWERFERFADKDWSFTDCTSKVVIEQLGITQAFARSTITSSNSAQFKSCHKAALQRRSLELQSTGPIYERSSAISALVVRIRL